LRNKRFEDIGVETGAIRGRVKRDVAAIVTLALLLIDACANAAPQVGASTGKDLSVARSAGCRLRR
jgi:hypothetical protein